MMKNIMGSIFALLVTLLITACGSTPATKVDYDEKTNFSSFKSFNVITPTTTSVDVNPVKLSRIENAIENTLTRQQFIFQKNSADLQITFHYSHHEKANSSSFSIGLGGSNMGSHSSTAVGVSTSIPLDSSVTFITKIFIDVSHNGKAVWHGSDIYETEGDMPAKEKEQAIATTIDRLLANFPPKKVVAEK